MARLSVRFKKAIYINERHLGMLSSIRQLNKCFQASSRWAQRDGVANFACRVSDHDVVSQMVQLVNKALGT